MAVEHVLQLSQCFLEMKPTTALPAGELHSEHSDHLPRESETIDIALIITFIISRSARPIYRELLKCIRPKISPRNQKRIDFW